MKQSKFSEQQIALILEQAEDVTTLEEVCRKAGISIQTYYRWRSKYGGLMPSEMKRLKQLKEENVRFKRLVANLSMEKEMLQGVIKRKLLGLIGPENWSAICSSVTGSVGGWPVMRSPIRYKSRRPDQASLQMRVKELTTTRVRCGYHRIHVMLLREGWAINHKRTRRINRELGLLLRNKAVRL
jgi:putative transposase